MQQASASLAASAAVMLTDGSAEVVRGALSAGVEIYAGYPITPASRIYEAMIAAGVGIGCPDEITVLQTLIGASLAGRKAMTATSGPGFALMLESLGAAQMMEAPLTLVLVQRWGPASGAATTNAQGDVLAPLAISGGMPVPTLCPARLEDCARLTAEAVNLAERLRTPVILLTERETVSTQRTLTLDEAGLALLETPPPASRPRYEGAPADFRPYGNLDAHQVPAFLEAGNRVAQTRFTASTHGEQAFILKATPEAVRNTTRLADKIRDNVALFPAPRLDGQEGADTLIVSFGCTDYAAREAVLLLRARGVAVSHLTLLTLYPIQAEAIAEVARGMRRVVVPEENLTGLYRRQLLGERLFEGSEVVGVNRAGHMVTPDQIVAEVMR